MHASRQKNAAERMIEKVMEIRKAPYDQTADDLAYWLSRPVSERIAAVEELRREYWGKDYADQPRLSRPLQVSKRQRS